MRGASPSYTRASSSPRAARKHRALGGRGARGRVLSDGLEGEPGILRQRGAQRRRHSHQAARPSPRPHPLPSRPPGLNSGVGPAGLSGSRGSGRQEEGTDVCTEVTPTTHGHASRDGSTHGWKQGRSCPPPTPRGLGRFAHLGGCFHYPLLCRKTPQTWCPQHGGLGSRAAPLPTRTPRGGPS